MKGAHDSFVVSPLHVNGQVRAADAPVVALRGQAWLAAEVLEPSRRLQPGAGAYRGTGR